MLSRQWYILLLPQDYLLLPLVRSCWRWWWNEREERSDVLHRGGHVYILQGHNVSQLYSVTDGGLRPHL